MAATVLAALWFLAGATASSVREDPPALLKLREFLADYEPRISELIADERFEQRQSGFGPVRPTRRVLSSEVSFLRLPGGLVWLGQRRVQRVNGRSVGAGAPTLSEALSATGNTLYARAKVIADENARYNLGQPRSVSLPTLPLDLLDARHAFAFAAAAGPTSTIRGQRVQLLSLQEEPPGRLVGFDDQRFVRTDVRAWVAPETGVLVRAEVDLFRPVPLRPSRHTISVEFARNAALDMFVPVELTEVSPGYSGKATYGRFRRFRTSARIVP